jgi:hypothetical protein
MFPNVSNPKLLGTWQLQDRIQAMGPMALSCPPKIMTLGRSLGRWTIWWLMDGYWMVYLFYNIWLVIWKMAWLL